MAGRSALKGRNGKPQGKCFAGGRVARSQVGPPDHQEILQPRCYHSNLLLWAQVPVALEGQRTALERVGYENLTREAINEGLQSVANLDVGGVVPLVMVDPDYPIISKCMKISKIQDGKSEVVSDWIECPVVKPRD